MGHWVEIEKKMSGFLVRIWFTSCLKVIETIYRGRALDNAFSICKTIVPPLGSRFEKCYYPAGQQLD